MGDQKVIQLDDKVNLRGFMQKIMEDVSALEKMIEQGMIEEGVTRIGAEQELCLLDRAYRPAPIADELLGAIDDPHFTNELAKFNLEINLDPLKLEGGCFSILEKQINGYVKRLHKKARSFSGDYILSGILPTIRSSDLTLENMTPRPRYYALNEAILKLRGEPQNFRIQGTDELIIKNDSVMFESCNTSFQLHYQVGAENFAPYYNWAQAVSGPVLSACTNSPLFLGKRLWSETRIALFRQSTDTRGNLEGIRERKSRVFFGDNWVESTVLDLYKDNITTHRPILGAIIEDDALETLKNNQVPRLKALSLYNGTIYQWNRACYGISEGLPHLRIENRYLPAGPTVLDEVSNAAFWVGLMHGVPEEYLHIDEKLDFDVAKTNFLRAGRMGLEAKFQWINQASYSAEDLLLHELLPIAKEGLAKANIVSKDIDKYLGIMEERIRSGQTGSYWIINSYNGLKKEHSVDASIVAVTAAMVNRQKDNLPGHQWAPAQIEEAGGGFNRFSRIDQIMSRKLYTVNEEDMIDLVPNIMKWKQIRHLLVENDQGELVGLVTLGRLGKHYSLHNKESKIIVPVKDIMATDLITVTYNTPTVEGIDLMLKHKIGCLPVVNEENKLVGIVTERDFLSVAGFFLKDNI